MELNITVRDKVSAEEIQAVLSKLDLGAMSVQYFLAPDVDTVKFPVLTLSGRGLRYQHFGKDGVEDFLKIILRALHHKKPSERRKVRA